MELTELFESLIRNPDDQVTLDALKLCLRDEVPELAAYYQEFRPACHAALSAVLMREGRFTNDLRGLAAAQVCARHGLHGEPPPVIVELLAALAVDPLCELLLTETINTSMPLERFLTRARRFLLRVSHAEERIAPELRPLLVALAHQGFNNEFVFPVTDEEERVVVALGEQLGRAVRAGEIAEASRLWLLYSLYRPLAGHPEAAALAAVPADRFPADLLSLFSRTLLEPRREAELAAAMPVLGAVQDPVSRAVRAQYEENPYPRWLRFARSTKSILARNRCARPGFAWPEEFCGQPLQVLVAGCGTGQHSLQVALGNPDAEILALDLSTASLAYAMRMTERHGVRNITFLQGDLLALPTLGRKFHHIECVGVLHHIRDHAAAWAVLADCLHPGGTLRIGVYSKVARLLVTHLRGCIQREAVGPTPVEVRRFRERLIEDPAWAKLRPLLEKITDFFSLSTVRDLLFHVQEHQYTVAEIEGLTRGLGLELLGVSIPRARERTRMPPTDERVMVQTFEQWRAREMAFVGLLQMFRFSLQKPALAPGLPAIAAGVAS